MTGRRCAGNVPFDFSALLAMVHEGKPLEQHHILLVLEQSAVERRDRLRGIARLENLQRQILVQEQFQPVDQLAGLGLLLEARHLADLVENVHRLPDGQGLDARGNVMDPLVAELTVAQPRDRVIFVQTLMGLGGRLNVPFDQGRAPLARATSCARTVLPVPGSPLTRSGRRKMTAALTATFNSRWRHSF